jgi:ribosome-associated protein
MSRNRYEFTPDEADPTAASDDPAAEAEERPSRSARKRAAEAAQKLGERLLELREPDLVALNLPEELLEAVRDARRLGPTPAQARARQYIGKLMRRLDTEPIERALETRSGDWRPRAKLPR